MEKVENPGIEDLYPRMTSEQLNSLISAIKDLNNLIGERQSLNQIIFKDIERIKQDIRNFLLEAGSQTTYQEKMELFKKLIEIEEVQLQEKLNLWRDVATLKKELREREKELSEKQARLDVMSSILEG